MGHILAHTSYFTLIHTASLPPDPPLSTAHKSDSCLISYSTSSLLHIQSHLNLSHSFYSYQNSQYTEVFFSFDLFIFSHTSSVFCEYRYSLLVWSQAVTLATDKGCREDIII